MSEYYVDDLNFIVKIPQGLKEVGVLLERPRCREGIAQAYEIQRRLRVWRPRRAAVMGAAPSVCCQLALRLRGLQVTTFGKTPKPISTRIWLKQLAQTYQFDAAALNHRRRQTVRPLRHNF